MPAAFSLRPIRAQDGEFLFRVYAGTRAEELSVVPWSEDRKEAFLRMQFEAQHRYYQENYPGSSFDVVMVEDEPVGRLYVARWRDELRIIDIALLPHFQRRGIGSALLGSLRQEAEERALPLRIHVERHNPARALYERLGFREIADRGVYLFLEWRPPQAKPAAPVEAS